jgi:hypothetical protein
LIAPHGALLRLSDWSQTEFPHLISARERTCRELERVRAALAGAPCPDDACVVVFGSWGRGELTQGSDDDWAILIEGAAPEDRPDVAALDAAVREVLGGDARKPGTQDVFGCAFGCDELVAQIGLDKDTNTLLTRRMLVLLESASVLNPRALTRCHGRVLDTYLKRGTKDFRVPRFLLNDLVRYWRTICVDFEGKHWGLDAADGKWLTRNAKLRNSRKVLFASGLLPVLDAMRYRADEQGPFLHDQLGALPTDRVAYAFLTHDEGSNLQAGARGMLAYDRFIRLLGTPEVRDHLLELAPADRDRDRIWAEIRSCGRELEQSLLALLFGPDLAAVTRTHLIF